MIEKAARGPVRDLLEGQEQRGKRRLHEPRERKISPSHHHHIFGSADVALAQRAVRSEEHTSELQSLMRISYAVFCLKKKKTNKNIDKLHCSTHSSITITHTTNSTSQKSIIKQYTTNL